LANQIFLLCICYLFISSEFIVKGMNNKNKKLPIMVRNKYAFTYIIGFVFFVFIEFVLVESKQDITSLYVVMTQYSIVFAILTLVCILMERKWKLSFTVVAMVFIFPLTFTIFDFLSSLTIVIISIYLFFTLFAIFDILNQKLNAIEELEIDEEFRSPSTFYTVVEEFDTLVVRFEEGMYTADEFKNAKSEWIDQLTLTEKPVKMSELLLALLPYLKNSVLEDEEIMRIKKLY